MIRPIYAETQRYGDYSRGGEFVYDHPFQWGSRRIGPDLQREGVKQTSNNWHIRHLIEPKSMTKGSIMPNYPHLLTQRLDYESIPVRMHVMQELGVPYTQEDLDSAVTRK
jgi:cytochrome c oxidase cbb3-type subunit I/II